MRGAGPARHAAPRLKPPASGAAFLAAHGSRRATTSSDAARWPRSRRPTRRSPRCRRLRARARRRADDGRRARRRRCSMRRSWCRPRRRARFQPTAARLAQDRRRAAAAQMTLTGPWPPYNFVSRIRRGAAAVSPNGRAAPLDASPRRARRKRAASSRPPPPRIRTTTRAAATAAGRPHHRSVRFVAGRRARQPAEPGRRAERGHHPRARQRRSGLPEALGAALRRRPRAARRWRAVRRQLYVSRSPIPACLRRLPASGARTRRTCASASVLVIERPPAQRPSPTTRLCSSSTRRCRARGSDDALLPARFGRVVGEASLRRGDRVTARASWSRRWSWCASCQQMTIRVFGEPRRRCERRSADPPAPSTSKRTAGARPSTCRLR